MISKYTAPTNLAKFLLYLGFVTIISSCSSNANYDDPGCLFPSVASFVISKESDVAYGTPEYSRLTRELTQKWEQLREFKASLENVSEPLFGSTPSDIYKICSKVDPNDLQILTLAILEFEDHARASLEKTK